MANHMYMYGGGERERKKEGKVEGGSYFKELAHMIVEAWQSRLETEGRVVVCVSRQSAGTIFSFSGEIRLCFIKARLFF